MTVVRRALMRIGGPNSVSWPAFWVTYALLVIGHFLVSGPLSISVPERLLLVTVTQAASFAPLLLLYRLAHRSAGERPRPMRALGFFAVSGALRGLVLAWLLSLADPNQPPQWLYRASAGVLTVTLTLSIVAVLVDGSRTHAQRMASLLAAQSAISESREVLQARVTRRNEQLVAGIRQSLEAEIGTLDPDFPQEALDQLQFMVSDVVQPMSLELTREIPWLSRTPAVPPVKLEWRPLLQAATSGHPFAPFVTGLIMFVMGVPTAQLLAPEAVVQTQLGLLLAPAAALALANQVVGWIPDAWGLVRRGAWTLLALVAASALCGLLLVGIAQTTDRSTAIFVTAGFFTAVLGALIALARATIAEQTRVEGLLSQATEHARWALARVAQVLWFEQMALAQTLHGPVQSQISAAAIRLEDAVRTSAETAGLISSVRESILGALSHLDARAVEPVSLPLSVERLVALWSQVCVIDVDLPHGIVHNLSDDPPAERCAADIVVEGAANAIRHSEATHVTISFAAVADCDPLRPELLITVRDNGEGPIGRDRSGLGTEFLEQTTVGWTLEALDDGHVLTARIPTLRPVAAQT